MVCQRVTDSLHLLQGQFCLARESSTVATQQDVFSWGPLSRHRSVARDENSSAQSFCMQLPPAPSLPSSRHCGHGLHLGDRLVADAARPRKRQPRDWTSILVGRLKCRSHLRSLLKDKVISVPLRAWQRAAGQLPSADIAPQPIKGTLIRAVPFQLERRSSPARRTRPLGAVGERAPGEAK